MTVSLHARKRILASTMTIACAPQSFARATVAASRAIRRRHAAAAFFSRENYLIPRALFVLARSKLPRRFDANVPIFLLDEPRAAGAAWAMISLTAKHDGAPTHIHIGRMRAGKAN